MEVIVKCPPEADELEAAKERGFEKVELYLERKHLDMLKRTIETVRESGLEVRSVHTPHVHVDEDKAYFVLVDYLAEALDAYITFHSQYMHHSHIPQLEKLDLEASYGYENNPGASKRHLEENILKKDHEMILDVAHFYMADPEDYVDDMEELT